MGGQKHYLKGGQFNTLEYESIENSEVTIAGITCKIIKRKNDLTGTKSSLPQYSGRSDAYVLLGKDGKPKQLRLYKNHRMWKDFDWGHTHVNTFDGGIAKGSTFPKGTVHVQSSTIGFNNAINRKSDSARWMTDYEISTVGKLIQYYAPWVKLK